MLRRAVLGAFAVLATNGTAAANAAENDCAVLSALISAKASDAQKVTVAWTRDGVVLRHKKMRLDLPAFDNCDLYGALQLLEINCYWRFTDEAEALVRFDDLRNVVAPCMPLGLTSREGRTAEKLRYHRVEDADIEHDKSDIAVQIDMIEFFGDEPGQASRYWVSFELDRDSR